LDQGVLQVVYQLLWLRLALHWSAWLRLGLLQALWLRPLQNPQVQPLWDLLV